jgi:hypothetical protein
MYVFPVKRSRLHPLAPRLHARLLTSAAGWEEATSSSKSISLTCDEECKNTKDKKQVESSSSSFSAEYDADDDDGQASTLYPPKLMKIKSKQFEKMIKMNSKINLVGVPIQLS